MRADLNSNGVGSIIMSLLGYQVVIEPENIISKEIQHKKCLIFTKWESVIAEVFGLAKIFGERLENARILSLYRQSSKDDCVTNGEASLVRISAKTDTCNIFVKPVFAAEDL